MNWILAAQGLVHSGENSSNSPICLKIKNLLNYVSSESESVGVLQKLPNWVSKIKQKTEWKLEF